MVHSAFLWLPIATAVFASPIPNGTSADQGSWVTGPTGRGTFDLLRTCLIALIICVWTAIHPNVILNVTPLKSLGVKFLWMLYGLFSPEILVGYSLAQMLEAIRLRKSWCEHYKVKCGSKEDLMGMQGAFFVVMGGVTFGPRDSRGQYPATLTAETYMDLIRQSIIPKDFLNRRIIEDRSKADGLAKLVACLQASWMFIQCVVRKAIGLPVTLLEFHVTIQVVCAVVMYGFWWYKLCNANEPIPVMDYQKSGALRFCYLKSSPLVVGVMHGQSRLRGPEKGGKETSNSLSRILLENPNIHPESKKDLFNITTSVTTSSGGNKSFSRLPTSGAEGSQLSDDKFFIRLSPKCGNNLLQVGCFPTAVEFVPVCDSAAILLQQRDPSRVSPSGNLIVLPGESLVAEDGFFISLLYPDGNDTCIVDSSLLREIRNLVQILRE